MGLGADTIRAFAEGPYRRAEEMRVQDSRRIKALVELRQTGVPSSALYWVAVGCGNLDVFEAVAHRDITAEDGGWLLSLKRIEHPWYLRLAFWLFNRAAPPSGEGKDR